MARLVFTAHIDRSAEQTFKFMADSSHWPDVEVGLVDLTPKGVVALGSKGTQTRSMRGRNVEATWEIAELVENRKIAIAGGGPGMKVLATTEFTQGATGTDVTFTFDYWPQGLLMRLMSPLIRGQFKKNSTLMMTRMKSAVEKAVPQ